MHFTTSGSSAGAQLAVIATHAYPELGTAKFCRNWQKNLRWWEYYPNEQNMDICLELFIRATICEGTTVSILNAKPMNSHYIYV